jgi:hypothetical protein
MKKLIGTFITALLLSAGVAHADVQVEGGVAGSMVKSRIIWYATDCSSVTKDSWICYDTDDKILYMGDGTTANPIGGATSLTSAAVIADNTVVRGDGGARGLQDSGIVVDDNDKMVMPTGTSAGYFFAGDGSNDTGIHEDGTDVLKLQLGNATRWILVAMLSKGTLLIQLQF